MKKYECGIETNKKIKIESKRRKRIIALFPVEEKYQGLDKVKERLFIVDLQAYSMF